MFSRRSLLAAMSAAAALPAWAAQAGLQFGAPRPFSLDRLRGYAKKLASQPYKAAVLPPPDLLRRINYESVHKVHFRPEAMLWRGNGLYPISFLHLADYSREAVTVFVVKDGAAREILYRPDYFDYDGSGLDPRPLANLGFSGFQVRDNQTASTDWLVFQGASYFRTAGQDHQYGASARGIAINTALQTTEEFPRFTQFWLEQNGPVVTIYALLDGPSLTGAYKFDAMKRDGAVMNVHCDLFFRADITRLGVAPLTSMYWYGENQRDKGTDWRPEIHDNDGLAIWNGRGERIWRPLINPPLVQTNSFLDKNPKGFGLMQRDRAFDDYQDDIAFYNRRPGIWIEPKGQWGAGAVQLVEIPTTDEVHDNIVVYWRPDAPVSAGDKLSLDYRLYWQNSEPAFPRNLARVMATRIGRLGPPGPGQKRRFAVDFEGGALATLTVDAKVKPMLDVSRGGVEDAFVVKLNDSTRWRLFFNLVADGNALIDLRCILRLGGKTLSETWIYQYFP